MQNALGRRRAFALGRANICYWGNSEVSALREFFAVWPKSDIRAAFWEGPNDNQARAESGHTGMVRNAAGGELPFVYLQGRAEQALHGAARRVDEALEVLDRGRHRAPTLGRLHGGLDMTRDSSPPTRSWYVVPAVHNHVDWVVVLAAIVSSVEKLKVD